MAVLHEHGKGKKGKKILNFGLEASTGPFVTQHVDDTTTELLQSSRDLPVLVWAQSLLFVWKQFRGLGCWAMLIQTIANLKREGRYNCEWKKGMGLPFTKLTLISLLHVVENWSRSWWQQPTKTSQQSSVTGCWNSSPSSSSWVSCCWIFSVLPLSTFYTVLVLDCDMKMLERKAVRGSGVTASRVWWKTISKHVHCSIWHSLVVFSTSWEESQPQPAAPLRLFGSAGLRGACPAAGLVNQDDHVPTQRFRSAGHRAREQATAATLDNLHCSGK